MFPVSPVIERLLGKTALRVVREEHDTVFEINGDRASLIVEFLVTDTVSDSFARNLAKKNDTLVAVGNFILLVGPIAVKGPETGGVSPVLKSFER